MFARRPSNSANDLNLQFILTLFDHVMGRKPNEAETARGLEALRNGKDPRDYLLKIAANPEARQNILKNAAVPLFVPPGHFYSPIVNVAELVALRAEQAEKSDLLDIDANPGRQLALFRQLSGYFGRIPFPVAQTGTFRYYFENDFYSYGDALMLSAFIQHFRPRRIIEVGCGFSSAVILDTLDRMTDPPANTNYVLVEPYTERLKLLLRSTDYRRITVIEKPVQQVDLELFVGLQENDILFLDTTHILKTGSDVHHELFQILPRLKPGVLIHFHDVFHGFEYPEAWTVQQNRSWNELYALRALLMNNSRYQIEIMNATVAASYPDEVRSISREFMKNPGGALWLRKTASRASSGSSPA